MRFSSKIDESRFDGRSAVRAVGAAAVGMAAVGSADPAQAFMVVTPVGDTIAAGEQAIYDVDGDGVDDVRIMVDANGSRADLRVGSAVVGGEDVEIGLDGSFNPLKLPQGDFVDAADFVSPNRVGNKAKLFFDTDQGTFGDVGDTGFVPLKFTEPGLCWANGGCDADVVNYGWIELTRGSLTVNSYGYQTTPGAAAPTVPVPAPLALLATGALGLAALRRRREAL